MRSFVLRRSNFYIVDNLGLYFNYIVHCRYFIPFILFIFNIVIRKRFGHLSDFSAM